MPTAKIYFVRHGETDENRQGIIQGHLDTDLNAIGLEQSEVVAKELKSVPFDAGFSSDLKRAVKVLSFELIWEFVDLIQAPKTAEIILNYQPGVQLQKQSEMRERVSWHEAMMFPPIFTILTVHGQAAGIDSVRGSIH